MKLFREIRLRTPESVELEFSLAGIGSRAYALGVDYTVISLLMALFLLVWSIVATQVAAYLDNPAWLGSWILGILLLVMFAIFVGYFVFFETLWQGQTPGKRLAQIRVIRDDGRPIALPQALLRALLRGVDDLFFFVIGFGMILINAQEKRLGDLVAGTVVIQEQRSSRGKIDVQPSESVLKIATYLQEHDLIAHLKPDDFAIVREYLKRRPKLASHARKDVSLRLAQQVKERLELSSLPFDLTPDTFLEGVYLSYQQQSRSDSRA